MINANLAKRNQRRENYVDKNLDPFLKCPNKQASFNRYLIFAVFTSKGQIKLKANCRAIDSPKKRTNEFVLFPFLLFMANMTKKICSFLFLGESTARPNCFWSYLTFSSLIGVFHYCDFCLRVSGQIFLCSSKLW